MSAANDCPLCRDVASSIARIDSRDAYRIECNRCGAYHATGRAKSMLGAKEPQERLRLTWATRQADELGTVIEFDSENIDAIMQSVGEPSPPTRKADLLLQLCARRTSDVSRAAVVSPWDWPLVFARSKDEFAVLTAWLTKYIRQTPDGFWLTPEGWERVAQLDAEKPKSTLAFVAMRFNEELKPAYDEGFFAALHGLGYDPIRVDREHYLGKIDDFIIASIRKSALLVADVTEMRTGVFFEAGFGLGLGIPVVWSCRDDFTNELEKHFDTRQFNHLTWKDPADLRQKLTDRIEATVLVRPKPRGGRT